MDLRHPSTRAAAVLGGAVLFSLLAGVRIAVHSPDAHLVIETTAALVAAVTAYVFLGRFRQRRHLRDLVITYALAALAFTNLAYSVIPAVAIGPERGHAWRWAAVLGVVAAAALFAMAGFARDRRLLLGDRLPTLIGAATAAAVAAAGIASATVLPSLQTRSEVQAFDAPAAVLALQLVAAVLFASAAAGFLRSPERGTDELLSWLAAGCTLAGLARIGYFVYPSIYSNWVSAGDVLRLGFYLVLLLGAAREVRRYWEALATAAVLEDRRRMARELHDGLAQELAFIVMHAKLAACADDPRPLANTIAAAAERALAEARHAITALVQAPDAPLTETVAETAAAVAARTDLRLDLALADDVAAPADVREALVRIVREAVWNSARHANASRVAVELENGRDVRLRVSDDGAGFDPAEASSDGGGFGLISMRERAEAVGAEFVIDSAPGRGTAIEVIVR